MIFTDQELQKIRKQGDSMDLKQGGIVFDKDPLLKKKHTQWRKSRIAWLHPTDEENMWLFKKIMPEFMKWLQNQYSEVEKVYGYQIKELRNRYNIAKAHFVDAYLASMVLDDKLLHNLPKEVDIDVYIFEQFRALFHLRLFCKICISC